MDRLFVAAFEGTSRIPGVALGAMRLLAAFREAADGRADAELEKPRIVRELTKNSAMWCRKLHGLAQASDCKLMLGGEHLVTFPMLEVLVKRHPNLRLVVLDAHHDAYVHPLLTHWSLFHFAVRELGIPTLMLGVRHETDKADAGCEIVSFDALRAMGIDMALARIDAFAGEAPLYFSVDVDVLDPSEFPAVSDPVAGGVSIDELTRLVRGVLARNPVAADIVEYNSLRDPDGAVIQRLQPLLREYAQWFM